MYGATLYAHQLKTHANLFLCSHPQRWSVGPVPDTNFRRFHRMIKPSGLMSGLHAIWVADWNYSHPIRSACSLNLQAVFNEMSPLWHGPRPCRWTFRQDTSWAERSLRITAPVSWPGLKRVWGDQYWGAATNLERKDGTEAERGDKDRKSVEEVLQWRET